MKNITIETIQSSLKFLPIPKEVKDSIMENIQILIEFREFISKKYSISIENAEEKIKNNIMQSNNNESIHEIVEKSYNYCISEGFSKSDDLKESLTKLISIQSNL